MSEEKFYQSMRDQLVNFSPEVPAAVYGGMRRKYVLSRFLGWNMSSFNVWYLGALLTIGGIAVVQLSSPEVKADKAMFDTNQVLTFGKAFTASTFSTEHSANHTTVKPTQQPVTELSNTQITAGIGDNAVVIPTTDATSAGDSGEKPTDGEVTSGEPKVTTIEAQPTIEEKKSASRKAKTLTVPVIKDNK